MYNDIKEFHKKFGLPIASEPSLLPFDIMRFRIKFLREELRELDEAYDEGDLHGVADALVDLVYVALGTAQFMNLPFEELWKEVHAANMRKKRAGNEDESKRSSIYDVVKPEGWKPPDFTKILGDNNARTS